MFNIVDEYGSVGFPTDHIPNLSKYERWTQAIEKRAVMFKERLDQVGQITLFDSMARRHLIPMLYIVIYHEEYFFSHPNIMQIFLKLLACIDANRDHYTHHQRTLAIYDMIRPLTTNTVHMIRHPGWNRLISLEKAKDIFTKLYFDEANMSGRDTSYDHMMPDFKKDLEAEWEEVKRNHKFGPVVIEEEEEIEVEISDKEDKLRIIKLTTARDYYILKLEKLDKGTKEGSKKIRKIKEKLFIIDEELKELEEKGNTVPPPRKKTLLERIKNKTSSLFNKFKAGVKSWLQNNKEEIAIVGGIIMTICAIIKTIPPKIPVPA